jgi:hypothetical protein
MQDSGYGERDGGTEVDDWDSSFLTLPHWLFNEYRTRLTPATAAQAVEHGWVSGEDERGLYLTHTEHPGKTWRSVPQTSTANRKMRRQVGIRTSLRDLEEYKRMKEILDTEDEREDVGT